MVSLNERIAALDAEIAVEETKIADAIAEACRTHTSVHEGYWNWLWALRQKRRALQIVAEAFADALTD